MPSPTPPTSQPSPIGNILGKPQAPTVQPTKSKEQQLAELTAAAKAPPPARSGAVMTNQQPPARPVPAKPAASPSPGPTFGAIPTNQGLRVGIYGPGGIGKTTLAARAPGPVAFIDLDRSLPDLGKELEGLDIRNVQADTWPAVRAALALGPAWDPIKTIVIDSVSRLQELATEHMIQTVPHEKGNKVTKIEDYGYKSGYRNLLDLFMPVLQDLDAHVRAGRNVVLVLHECTKLCPNPQGDDWLRYEPRLEDRDNCPIRYRVKEWLAHLLFIGYEVVVTKDQVGKGSGERRIYPCELPHCMAKSRSLGKLLPAGTTSFAFPDGSQNDFWGMLL